jgi:hypothetical protein
MVDDASNRLSCDLQGFPQLLSPRYARLNCVAGGLAARAKLAVAYPSSRTWWTRGSLFHTTEGRIVYKE